MLSTKEKCHQMQKLILQSENYRVDVCLVACSSFQIIEHYFNLHIKWFGVEFLVLVWLQAQFC